MENINIRNRKALRNANNIFSDIKPLLIFIAIIILFYKIKSYLFIF